MPCIGTRPPLQTVRLEINKGIYCLINVVLRYLQSGKPEHCFFFKDFCPVIVTILVVGNYPFKMLLSLVKSAVVMGITPYVQYRLRDPWTIGVLLYILLEQDNGISVFMPIPLLDCGCKREVPLPL
ncbi:hypothetical protein MBAV_001091 [Candidatus Magnetobacterium bavaricum]|uniref:Uncharacterized protein n=1 Tax=Candidatus Magnetobacterium bavaricum TaxID=29290 RepID=A0A0F3GXY7_9BACT|nr:hypothetical protein MBAV_001091 [Candidatus Magnetobacterium bavaricum]